MKTTKTNGNHMIKRILALGLCLLLAAGTVLLSVTVAALSSVMAAYRLSRIDPGAALREGN